MREVFALKGGGGKLWRQEIKRFGRSTWVWRTAPPGSPKTRDVIEFAEDREGHPVDNFDLPLLGEFVETFAKK